MLRQKTKSDWFDILESPLIPPSKERKQDDNQLDNCTWMHYQIPKFSKMSSVLYFFGKQVSNIDFTNNTLNGNKVFFNLFTNHILTHLDVAKTLSGAAFRPINTCIIIIEDGGSTQHKNMTEVEKI